MQMRRHQSRIRLGFHWIIAAATVLIAAVDRPAAAQPIAGLTTTAGALRAKAAPDECFIAIGFNLPFTKPPCAFGVPKVNQAYVWAMTKTSNAVWFGTTANPQCITQAALATDPSQLVPYQTASGVCEFGKSPYVALGILPALLGDFRPPQMFMYDTAKQTLRDVTPQGTPSPTNPTGLDPLVAATRGIRAAATVGNLVIMAGPSLLGGLNFFFFQADTAQFLGSGTLPGYDNIRQFLNVGDQLYAAVGQTFVGGAVLRWSGSQSAAPCSTCLAFAVVGQLDGIGAYIAEHHGHIFVTTWPTGKPDSIAGLFRSPRVRPDGLTAADAAGWTKVWSATDYEPDRAIAATYAGGALTSFDGDLYWGTMHVPWNATAVALQAYNYMPATDQEWTDTIVATFRTAVVFRGRRFGPRGRAKIELLYGEPQLSTFRPATADRPAHWEKVDNNMPAGHRVPLYGLSGFNNPYNTYIWSMAVWNKRLWVGTMDWSQPAEQGTEAVFESAGQPIPFNISLFFATQSFGGDLWFFQDRQAPAVAENSGGVGNATSYGVRNMVATAKSLFVGMANASNLLTGPTGPHGGWELIELSPRLTTPLNLLSRFSCRRADLQDDASSASPSADDNAADPTATTCIVRVTRPAPIGGLTVGVINLSPDIALDAPLFVTIPAGMKSARFTVHVSDASARAQGYLIAGLNGGTRVTTLEIGPCPDDGADQQ